MDDLVCEVTTNKGVKYKFVLISKGFHVLKVDTNMNGCIFGRQISNNGIGYGIVMYYAII